VATTAKFAKAQLDLREPVKDGKHFKPGASLGVLKFAFNPKDYSTALQAGWNFKPQKKPGEHPEFTGTQLRTMDVEMFLDATDSDAGDISESVKTLMSTVRPTEKSNSSGTPFPPIVIFSWGETDPFVAVVKSVTVNLTLFRPSGQPLRGTSKLSMNEYPTEPGQQNPTSGARRSTRAHRVLLGDTLASIANTEYGTPTLWRAIATANDLEDPFALRIGHELLIPPPADAVALA
jgi:hypothetical protein